MTGDRPTGHLHLGHLVGSLLNRVKLQDIGKQFVMVADVQALTDNADNPQKVRDNVLEVTLDNLAVGVDPMKTAFFIQSQIPEIAELTIFFMNLVTLARLRRNPTVKNEMQEKGYGDDVPAGFLAYPVSQAADILTFGATLIPVGEDQLPMIEQTNEIARKFNSYYGEVFKEVKPLVGDAPRPHTNHLVVQKDSAERNEMISVGARLPGIDGKAKMSKSLGNCVYLSDSDAEIERKVREMYTDPNHVSKDTPGRVEGNVVFAYLDVFSSGGGPASGGEEPLADLKARYQKGGVGDVEVKERLARILKSTLGPIRARREEFAREPEKVMKILEDGSHEARKVAKKTLKKVRKAMKVDYFS